MFIPWICLSFILWYLYHVFGKFYDCIFAPNFLVCLFCLPVMILFLIVELIFMVIKSDIMSNIMSISEEIENKIKKYLDKKFGIKNE